MFCAQIKRDILSETKYIELVLVADHQEVIGRLIDRRPSLIAMTNLLLAV